VLLAVFVVQAASSTLREIAEAAKQKGMRNVPYGSVQNRKASDSVQNATVFPAKKTIQFQQSLDNGLTR